MFLAGSLLVYTSFLYVHKDINTNACMHICVAVPSLSIYMSLYIDLFAVVLIAVREIASISDLEPNRRIVPVAVVSKSTGHMAHSYSIAAFHILPRKTLIHCV